MNGYSKELLEFLQVFFGDDNDLKFDYVMHNNGNAYQAIREMIEPLKTDQPAILPRRKDKRPVLWYGMAFSQSQLNKLWEETNAFVGTSYSNLKPGRGSLDLSKPIDKAVADLTGGYAFRFYGIDNKIWQSLLLKRRIEELSPTIVYEKPRVTGRVLRDFYMNLQAGQRDKAKECLQYLKENNRLDPLNLAFLKVQFHAELNQWDELLEISELNELLKIRRPLAVTRALIKAVYKNELLEFELEDNAPEGLRHFENHVFPLYSGLFTTLSIMKEPEVLKCFMMLAVMKISPQPELRDEILGLEGIEETDRRYLDELAGMLPGLPFTAAASQLEYANELLIKGNYNEALRQADKLQPSIQKVRILLECAYEIQSLESERITLKAINELTRKEMKTFMESRRNRDFMENIGASAEFDDSMNIEALLPHDWVSFMNRINKGQLTDIRVAAIAQKAQLEWEVDQLRHDPVKIQQLNDLLNNISNDRAEVVYSILPYLVSFFIDDKSWPSAEFKGIYSKLLILLIMKSEVGVAELAFMAEVVSGLLKIGVNEQEYKDIIDFLEAAWSQYYSESNLDWALDVLDILICNPCPLEEKRLFFMESIMNRLGALLRRVRPEQMQLLKLMLEDLNQITKFEDLLALLDIQTDDSENQTEDILTYLSGKTIGIYSLDEAAASRVKQLIMLRCDKVNIHISNDKVGNDKLKQLSRTADIFVIAHRCAKHAATIFIESNRPKELPIIWAQGKGSASMLQAIFDYVRSI